MCTENSPIKGELEFLRRLEHELGTRSVGSEPPPLPFGDDMAGLESGAPPLLWTTDMLMDGVDFESGKHTWQEIGRKAMAVNLSDCAAMAAQPIAALCAVALNDGLTMDDALGLHRGARDCAAQYQCPLVGGDTNSWQQPTTICVTIAARPEADRRPVTRAGARPGDRILLTGPVGGSILGRHMTFEPRIELALALNREIELHAMIDISDGLAIDLGHILDASGCGATLDEVALEAAIHPDAVRLAELDHNSPREHALHDGEDFELIVVLPPGVNPGVCARHGLLPVGRITREREFMLKQSNGRQIPIEKRGWEHFR